LWSAEPWFRFRWRKLACAVSPLRADRREQNPDEESAGIRLRFATPDKSCRTPHKRFRLSPVFSRIREMHFVGALLAERKNPRTRRFHISHPRAKHGKPHFSPESAVGEGLGLRTLQGSTYVCSTSSSATMRRRPSAEGIHDLFLNTFGFTRLSFANRRRIAPRCLWSAAAISLTLVPDLKRCIMRAFSSSLHFS